MAGAGVLDALKSQRPEWVPWLKVVEVAVREAANPQWDQFVSDVSGGVEPGAPLITGITLNVVAPGLHATDRVRELGHGGRLGDPEDFGRVVAFLCSKPAGFVSGTALQVDGAGTLGLL